MMKISKKGLALVKSFEGKSLVAYRCPANVLTICYGHTGSVNGKPIKAGMVVDDTQCDMLLLQDMADAEMVVSHMVRVPLNQNQFDALVSFTFNCGAGALQKSTLLRLLNRGQYDGVPHQLTRWNKVGKKVLPGLVRRRKAEGDLWEGK